jgi:hypothetical protein
VQYPYIESGPGLEQIDSSFGEYELSPQAIEILQPIFNNFGYDLGNGNLRILFGDTHGNFAEALGSTVTIDTKQWTTPQTGQWLRVWKLAHELTHVVQFQWLSKMPMSDRYNFEVGKYGSNRYYDFVGGPVAQDIGPFAERVNWSALWSIPIEAINPIDISFPVDALADRVGFDAYVRWRFH